MLLMEKMLPHLGYVQPTFHVLSQLARPVPLPLGQQLPPLPALSPFSNHNGIKLGGMPPNAHEGGPHPLSFSVLGRGGGGGFLERTADHSAGLPSGLPSPYDRDDEKGETCLTRWPTSRCLHTPHLFSFLPQPPHNGERLPIPWRPET